MGMKVLVTGGAGFIGSHIVDRLVQEGYEVIVVDDLSAGKRKNVNRAARFYKADIRGRWLERVFRKERPAVVSHHAAQINVRRSVEDPVADADINILGMLNVLQNSVTYGVRKVVFASSGGAIYGEPEKLVGRKVVFIARFVEGLRQLNGVIAGIVEMPWRRFALFNMLGAATWVGFWSSVGYFAGNNVETITRYATYIAVAAGVVFLAWLAWHLRRRRQRRRR